jgi:hypothetical protein
MISPHPRGERVSVKPRAFGETLPFEKLRFVPIFHPPHPSTPRALTDWGNDCGELLLGTIESKAEETTAVVSFDLDDMYMISCPSARSMLASPIVSILRTSTFAANKHFLENIYPCSPLPHHLF